MKRLTVLLAILMLYVGAPAMAADTLYVGIDIQGPVQKWDTSGTFLGNFGQSGATGSAFDGAGNFWTVAPSFGNNTIEKYNIAGTSLGSVTAAVSVNDAGQWIEDMTYGNGYIWASTYEGWVFKLDPTTGDTIDSFNSGASFAGVTFDGTYLYTTNGFNGDDSIEKWTTTGTFVSSIHTTHDGGAGLGYSSSTNSFWVGYAGGDIRQFDMAGEILYGFNTGNNYFHDGLEVYSPNAVPEPEIYAMLGIGLGLMGWVGRRRKLQAA